MLARNPMKTSYGAVAIGKLALLKNSTIFQQSLTQHKLKNSTSIITHKNRRNVITLLKLKYKYILIFISWQGSIVHFEL
jgi:hypothetical protein